MGLVQGYSVLESVTGLCHVVVLYSRSLHARTGSVDAFVCCGSSVSRVPYDIIQNSAPFLILLGTWYIVWTLCFQ